VQSGREEEEIHGEKDRRGERGVRCVVRRLEVVDDIWSG
jgi:hypothetical protein